LLIANRLLKARESAGLSLKDVNQKTGISTGNISCWENGKYLPGANALVSLSKLYNVTIDWILKGDEAFFDKNLMKDIFEDLLKNKQEWVLIEAIAALSKNEIVEYALKSYLAEQQDDPVLRKMIQYLKITWYTGDEKIKNWLEIQFQKCFPDYLEELQKKSFEYEDGTTKLA
jgi:transcriptional regulator with XRE-family HTH domain